MWRTTGDAKWRDRGWALFESLEKHAKVGSAYASVKDVREVPTRHEDDMPRYVLCMAVSPFLSVLIMLLCS